MDNSLIIGLFYNLALLLTLALLYTVFQNKMKSGILAYDILLGISVGMAGLLIMVEGFQITTGVMFDTRSILISVVGLFFGAIPTITAGAMMILYRIFVGGDGLPAGILIIVVPGLIGILWNRYRFEKLLNSRKLFDGEFYAFGLIVHLSVLICTLSLPKEVLQSAFDISFWSAVILYPLGTFLLSTLLKKQYLNNGLLIKLRETSERLQNIIQGTNSGTWEWNVSTGEQLINERWAEIIGYTREEISPVTIETWRKFCHPEDLIVGDSSLEEVFLGEKEYYEFEFRMRHKSGEWIWVSSRGRVNTWTSTGSPKIISGTHTDITSRKKLEEELKLKQMQFSDVIEFLPDATLAINKDKKIIIWNKAIEQMTGIPSSEMMGKGDYAYTVPFYGFPRPQLMDLVLEKPAGVVEHYSEIKMIDKTIEAEAFCPALNGKKGAWIFMKVSPLHDQYGNVIGVIESIRDISEKKRAENALVEKENRLIEAQRIGKFGNWEFDIRNRTYWGSKEALEIFGIQKEEGCFTQDELARFLKEQVRNTFKGVIEELISGETEKDFEFELQRQNDGQHRILYAKSRMELDPMGQPVKLLGVVQDITEKFEAQTDLKKSEERFRIIFEEAPLGIGLFDFNTGKAKQINKKFTEIFGRTKEEMYNIPWESISYPGDLAENNEYRRRILEGEIQGFNMKKRYFKKDGSIIWINLTIALLDSLEEENPSELCMIEDITEKVKRDEEILYLSCHDVLTGLYNRMFFEEEKKRLDTVRQLPLSVIMGDVDGLKLINDGFGYANGDNLLIKAGQILSKCCRAEDIISRVGGDEFCILLPQTTSEMAREISKRIHELCEETSMELGSGTVKVSISVGYDTKTRPEQELSMTIVNAENSMRRRKLLERKSIRSDVMTSIKATMLEKSHETAEHADRLVMLSKAIGKKINLSDNKLFDLELAATLHDIGKMSIDRQILIKPGVLTDEEWGEIKKHPEAGYRIAQATSELMPIAEYILTHHERWDGKGYPQGLKKEEIPLLARIINVVDSYDAMTSIRPYGKPLTKAEAIREIETGSGSQFDPALVRIFIDEVLPNL